MDDIVSRLRDGNRAADAISRRDMDEAANEIERLRRVEQAAIKVLDVTSVGDQYFVACLNGEESQEIRLALVKLSEAIRAEGE